MLKLRWIQFPGLWLALLLQRAPALRQAAVAAEEISPSRIVQLLRAAFAGSVSLGGVHSLAGATQLVASPKSPLTVATGASVQVAMTITGAQTPAASWSVTGSVPPGLSFNGGATRGTVNVSTLVLSGTPTTPGSYVINLQAWEKVNASGDRSSVFPYTVVVTGTTLTAPRITSEPANQTVTPGADVTFSVIATGSPEPTYQWRKNNVAIAGATSPTLTLRGVQADAAGTYVVVISNSVGSVSSRAATLAVNAPAVAGSLIAVAPQSQHVAPGASVMFSVTASGAGLSYQWSRDGAAIPGATQSTYAVSSANAAAMGFYGVTVRAASGATESALAILTLRAGGTSRLVNVSTRGYVPPGGALTPGFVLQGNARKPVLIRAIGPTLGFFGVGGTLADPVMEVIPLGESAAVASNDNWGGTAALSTAFSKVGAFALAAASSGDASVEASLPVAGAKGYTVRITGKGADTSGIALAEVYDEDGVAGSVRLVNVSTSGFVGTGDQALVPGFFIGGDAPKLLLIRAVGPGLAQFGVPETLADPQLAVTPLGKDFAVASNDNWGGTTELRDAFAAAGAFALPAGSGDAAVLVRLPPGGYTVVVSGVASTTGTALVEVYDLDP
jgi:hypothetical protein